MEFGSFVVAWPSLAEQCLSLHPVRSPWTPKNNKMSIRSDRHLEATVIQKQTIHSKQVANKDATDVRASHSNPSTSSLLHCWIAATVELKETSALQQCEVLRVICSEVFNEV